MNEIPINPLEREILASIKKLLRILRNQGKLAFTRIHVMPIIRSGVPWHTRRTVTPNIDMVGFWDLEIVTGGTIGYIEVKRIDGKLSPAQVKFGEERGRQGAKLCVAHSLNEAIDFLEKEMNVDTGFRLNKFCRTIGYGGNNGISGS